MKMNKLAMIVAAGMALLTTSRADVNIYIAGAVSLKDVAYKTYTNLYGVNLVSKNLDTPTTPTSANLLAFTGKMTSLFGSQTVNLFCNYNGGSGPAIQSLAQNTSIAFYNSFTQGVTNTSLAPADVAFSIVFQKDYPYTTPVLDDTIYGATAPLLVKSPLAPPTLTNLTSQSLRLIFANGYAPQSVYTGKPTDTNSIYWVMRDIGAASRIILAKEAGFTGSQLGYYYDTNSTSWTLDTVGRTTWPVVVNQLTNTYGPCMGVITPADASKISQTNFLSVNGCLPFKGTFSTVTNDWSPVINGQYTVWGFEHIMSRKNPPTDTATFVAALINSMSINIASSALSIPLDQMKVSRNSTGGLVSP